MATIADKISQEWLDSLQPGALTEAFIGLSSSLNEQEADILIRQVVRRQFGTGNRVTHTGREFSGRYWLKGMFDKEMLLEIAEREFVQSVCPPIRSEIQS